MSLLNLQSNAFTETRSSMFVVNYDRDSTVSVQIRHAFSKDWSMCSNGISPKGLPCYTGRGARLPVCPPLAYPPRHPWAHEWIDFWLLVCIAENKYSAEIMICGGNSAKAVLIAGNSGASTANGRVPADYNCWRITPEAPNPTWTKEPMCNYPKCDTMLRR